MRKAACNTGNRCTTLDFLPPILKNQKIGIHRSDLSDAYFSVPVQNHKIWVA
jgi:hypothetical protein